MPANLQRVINSGLAVRLVSLLARGIPPRLAYPICDRVGSWVAAQQHSKLTQAYRLNQWVIRGQTLDRETLDQAVQETLRNAARSIYELYHYMDKPEAVLRQIHFSQQAHELVSRPEFAERGLMILGLHLSNFDLILQSICRQGLKVMVLTLPDPQGARQVEYERRRRIGMTLLPTSAVSLRRAIRHLEQGGMVLTGIDRPVPAPKYHPTFFHHPASLPIEYIYPALKARVPAVTVAAIREADGTFNMMCSEPIEMEDDPDQEHSILSNAGKALKQAETFIRLAPEQWNVPLPLWPDLFEEVPG